MGIEYQHVMMTNHKQVVAAERVADLLRKLVAESYLNNEELDIYNNTLRDTHKVNDDKIPVMRTTVTDFINNRHKEIEDKDYMIEIDLFTSVKSETYTRIFEQVGFPTEEIENLYGYKFIMTSSKYALFPSTTEIITDIFEKEESCFGELEYRSTFAKKSDKEGVFSRLFMKRKNEGTLYDSFPLMHLPRDAKSDNYTIEYRYAFTNELLQQNWFNGNVVISFDMNKCVPRDGLTKLETTVEFKKILKDVGFEIVSEFGSWS